MKYYCLVSLILGLGLMISNFSPAVFANTPIWNDKNVNLKKSFVPKRQHYPSKKEYQGKNAYKRFRSNVFSRERSFRSSTRIPVTCRVVNAKQFTGRCLSKTPTIKRGLLSQASYLRQQQKWQRMAPKGANLVNKHLLETVTQFASWLDGQLPQKFNDIFELRRLQSKWNKYSKGRTKFTGYFTPVLNARNHPNKKFRYPIYSKPKKIYASLSRAQISQGALRGKGLEIAWTDDPIQYFFAQVQGSGILKYPDGHLEALDYTGHNKKPFRQISDHMKRKGYLKVGLSYKNMRDWLLRHPYKINEVLNTNPRFIFFKRNRNIQKITASGQNIISGHTAAVDTNYIPFGAILLAEIPRVNTVGHVIGYDWKLLFSQDRGYAIRGPARIDLYMGRGINALRRAHSITGYGKIYLLIKKDKRWKAATR